MADELDTGGQPPNDNDTELQPGTEPQPQPEGGEGQQSDPIETLAQEMGWRPQDQFQGPAEKWKPAADFIKDGRDIQREQNRDIRDLRQQLDVIGKTSAQILQDRLAEQRRELMTRHAAAVEEGDREAALRIGQELNGVENRLREPIQQPTAQPVVQEFAERNAAWFQKDPAATARAVQITNELAKLGYSTEAQLKAAERTIKAEYPEHFPQGGQPRLNGHKPAAQPNQPAGRSGGGAPARKDFSAMPKAAQDVANDMVARGVIPNLDAYVKNYWINAERSR